jgi:hypothetical protein
VVRKQPDKNTRRRKGQKGFVHGQRRKKSSKVGTVWDTQTLVRARLLQRFFNKPIPVFEPMGLLERGLLLRLYGEKMASDERLWTIMVTGGDSGRQCGHPSPTHLHTSQLEKSLNDSLGTIAEINLKFF